MAVMMNREQALRNQHRPADRREDCKVSRNAEILRLSHEGRHTA